MRKRWEEGIHSGCFLILLFVPPFYETEVLLCVWVWVLVSGKIRCKKWGKDEMAGVKNKHFKNCVLSLNYLSDTFSSSIII